MAQQLPMAYHYMAQSSYIGYLILDKFDPAQPPLVEEVAKDTWSFIENIENEKGDTK